MKNTIYPCLWFDGNAREAAEFYCKVFKNTVIKDDNQLVVTFESHGQKFMCLNGGPHFKINPSISFFVLCETKEEVDSTWKSLSDGGEVLMKLDKYDWSERYGWLNDKFGVSWQLYYGKMEDVGQKFSPMLMFTGQQNGKAEEAIHFYTSVFEGSGVNGILKYEKGKNKAENAVVHGQFNLGKHVFMAMDSDQEHHFGFNEAVSLVVDCETQQEIDYYWGKLSVVPEAEQCGWLKDQFGISWQIVPDILRQLMSDPERAPRVTQAFMQMKKFDIEKLKQA